MQEQRFLSRLRGEPSTPNPTAAGEDKSEKHRQAGCGEHLNVATEMRK